MCFICKAWREGERQQPTGVSRDIDRESAVI